MASKKEEIFETLDDALNSFREKRCYECLEICNPDFALYDPSSSTEDTMIYKVICTKNRYERFLRVITRVAVKRKNK